VQLQLVPIISRASHIEVPEYEECLVDTDHDLDRLAVWFHEEGLTRCGLDTEADSLHSYREKLCLIQFCAGDLLAVIDPLKIGEEALQRFFRFLEPLELWFHGADFDMTLILRTFGFLPERILDTQIAARLMGHPRFGLANLVEEGFGVVLSKSSQKADWGSRPLKEKMLRYAFDDVRYLLPLADWLTAELREAGRANWFEESCRAARNAVLTRKERSPDDLWRVPGWGKLERHGLAYLRELWSWRDEEAERLDRPTFRVMSNQTLVELAERAAAGEDIRGSKGLRPAQSERLRTALRRAADLPREQWPPKRLPSGRPREDVNLDGYERLRKRRDETAVSRGIDPTIIATRSVLETLANDETKAGELLMEWQRELLFGGAPVQGPGPDMPATAEPARGSRAD
jgi:ribonuclease D